MTKRYAVIGNPVAQSLSPLMHSSWIADHGIDATYVAHLFDSGEKAFHEFLRARPFDGANITVPFKSWAMAAADTRNCDDDVANVLTWDGEGKIAADNTDGRGFIASLDEQAPGWSAKNVLVLGAGGAAAGIVRALKQKGREIVIANRTFTRAEELATQFHAIAAPWQDLPALFARADLVVQTTTLGMGQNESPDWPFAQCKPSAFAVDIVYKPLETPFLKQARAHGLRGVDGLGMLIHQGALAFEIWFGVTPDVKKARQRLCAALGEKA
ncbi:MAG: shikimate dehydrogenase [Caulobacterales bacterium]